MIKVSPLFLNSINFTVQLRTEVYTEIFNLRHAIMLWSVIVATVEQPQKACQVALLKQIL